MLDAALQYAEVGWPVFPLVPNSKVPLFPNPHPKGSPERDTCAGECGRDGHGVKDATTDRDRIVSWWRRCRRANVAGATGYPGPDVLDIDTKSGRDGLQLFERVRKAGLASEAVATIRTPSGGWHIWFDGTDQSGGAVGKDKALEFKACGGYVLLPPSYVVDEKYGYAGRYEVVEYREGPPGFVDFAAIRRLLEPPRKTYAPRLATADAYDGLIQHVANQGEGNRNKALFWALCRAIETGAGRDVLDALVDASVGTGLPRSSAEATLRSALKRHGSAR